MHFCCACVACVRAGAPSCLLFPLHTFTPRSSRQDPDMPCCCVFFFLCARCTLSLPALSAPCWTKQEPCPASAAVRSLQVSCLADAHPQAAGIAADETSELNPCPFQLSLDRTRKQRAHFGVQAAGKAYEPSALAWGYCIDIGQRGARGEFVGAVVVRCRVRPVAAWGAAGGRRVAAGHYGGTRTRQRYDQAAIWRQRVVARPEGLPRV